MKKKSLSILLGLCMIFTLLSLPVSAAVKVQEKPTRIGVVGPNGEANAVTAAPEDLPAGLSYDSDTNTLTMENVNITKYYMGRAYVGIHVYDSSNLTIRLIGNNVIRTSDECSYGILLDGSAAQEMVITGDGSLVVDGPRNTAIVTQGKLIIDSSVALLAGFQRDSLFNAKGGITIGGEPYTGNAKEGAVVNGKVIDKVRKTPLDLKANSAGYGTKGASFNPKTESVTVKQTGEGWGWNHETRTLTMSGTTIYSSTGDYALRLPFESTRIELTSDTENTVIGPDGSIVCAIQGTDFSINGSGGLTALGGRSTVESAGGSRAIDSSYLAISGSVRVTAIGGTANNVSIGLTAVYKLDISGSARVRAVTGRGGSCTAISQNVREGVFISENAYVETDTSNAAGSGTGLKVKSGNLEISGGTVKTLNSHSRGIDVSNVYDEEKGHVRITGGTVETSGNLSGLRATGNVTVTGGSVTASSPNAALESEGGAITIAPARKQLAVYGGAAAPGEKLAMVAASGSYTLSSEQLASKYMHIAYEPLKTEGVDIRADYTAGQSKQTLYSVDLTWGGMEFEYVDGDVAGTWNPATHKYEGQKASGWHYAKGTNEISLTNHSNIGLDVAFAFAPGTGYDAVTGSFAGAGITNGKATLASGEATTPENPPSVTAALTLSGALPANTSGVIGRATVTIDAATTEAKK